MRLVDCIHKKGEAEAVHNFRLAVKRLRALLPAVSCELPSVLDGVFRASGRVRDLDVQRKLFQRTLAASGVADIVLDDFLRARRRKARKRLRKITRSLDAAKLGAELRLLRKHACNADESETIAAVRRLLSLDEAELALLAQQLVLPRQIHAFRIKLKEALYLNRALPSGEQRKLSMEDAGEILGQWHDCETSQKTLMRFLKRHPGSRSLLLLNVFEQMKQDLFQGAMKRIAEATHV